jgi:hypothetical protein
MRRFAKFISDGVGEEAVRPNFLLALERPEQCLIGPLFEPAGPLGYTVLP